MRKKVNLENQRFGRLLVTGVAQPPEGRKGTYWNCLCDCGNEKAIRADALTKGATKSCGCITIELQRENCLQRNQLLATHRLTGTPLYKTWTRMKARCYDTNSPAYSEYGGRGIKICDDWVNCFEKFYSDMIGTYKEGLSINRIDPNGDYCMGNCEWADHNQQSRDVRKRNKSSTSKYKGVSWNKRLSTYESYVQINKKRYFIGYSDDDLELAMKYDEKIIEITGRKSGTNKALGLY